MEVATTVEPDIANVANLTAQIINNKGEKHNNEDIRSEKEQRVAPSSKKFTFVKGDQSFDVDDDAEIEFMADKKSTRMTLRELKDRAAGDVAVKNRMHSLAEEKKRVQSTMKQFAELSRTDPLGALEYISNKAKEADSDFEYNKYLNELADQAEKLGQMDETERKAFDLEKRLSKAEQDLSHKEREAALIERKGDILNTYPEIGESEFGQMVDAVLNNEDLIEGAENENDVLDKVEDLIQETLTQKDILTVIERINPSYVDDDEMVFALSDQIRQNPDLDEDDIVDIISELIQPQNSSRSARSAEREQDVRTLSRKQMSSTPKQSLRTQNATDFDILKMKLLEEKKDFKHTPKYMR